jgi:uncharacterized protein
MNNSYTIITGGLGGLGSAFALECAHQGKNLILIDQYEDGSNFVNYIQGHYDTIIKYYSCNLSDADARLNLFQELNTRKININGLFNVVGREFEGAFQQRTRDELLQLINLNISAMVDMTYHALHMRAPSERFMLVNVSSLAGFFPMPYKAVYSSTKRFIINFSLALWKEIESFGNVTVLCPAGLPTNAESMKKIFLQGFWGKITAQDTSAVVKKTIEKVEKNIPVYIPGLPNNIMVWLARIIPERMLASYLAKRWSGKQEELEIWKISEQ